MLNQTDPWQVVSSTANPRLTQNFYGASPSSLRSWQTSGGHRWNTANTRVNTAPSSELEMPAFGGRLRRSLVRSMTAAVITCVLGSGFAVSPAAANLTKQQPIQIVPTVPPQAVAESSLIPRSTESFSAVGWTIEPASTLRDEVISAVNGTTWRVERSGGKTKVTRSAMVEGTSTADKPVTIDGDWALGVVTARNHRSGASADGFTLVLAHGTKRDRFAMIQGGKSKILTFSGAFGLDAVANDGSMLFLIETVDEVYATYAVRKADLRTGLLIPGAIQNTDVSTKGVTASTSSEPAMRGKPLDRLIGSDGWAYTLYYTESHSYVHALDTAGSGNGLCFDLPSSWNSNAATLRLKLGADTMTVVRKSKTLGRLLGTRPGVAPKIALR
jgi:hypothetical protein